MDGRPRREPCHNALWSSSTFGRRFRVLLSLLPVAIGTTWLLGLMGQNRHCLQPGRHYDSASGHWHRRHQRNSHPQPLRRGTQRRASWPQSTGKAVLVSGLTAMTGFGSLVLGKHQGIQSLGSGHYPGNRRLLWAGF